METYKIKINKSEDIHRSFPSATMIVGSKRKMKGKKMNIQ
jgi:hypothetical protein